MLAARPAFQPGPVNTSPAAGASPAWPGEVRAAGAFKGARVYLIFMAIALRKASPMPGSSSASDLFAARFFFVGLARSYLLFVYFSIAIHKYLLLSSKKTKKRQKKGSP